MSKLEFDATHAPGTGPVFGWLLVFVLVIFSGCQTIRVQDDQTVYEKRLSLHRQVWELVRSQYYDPDFGGKDWNQIALDSVPEIEKAQDLKQVYAALQRMVNRLEDRHTFLLTPEEYAEEKRNEYVGVGFMTFNHPDEQDLNVVIRVVPESPADQAGIKPGWLFLNGLEVNPGHQVSGVKENFRFLDHFQQLHEIALVPEDLPKTAADWQATLLDDNILYLRFDNFDEGLEQWIAGQLIDHEAMKGLILDVRWNPGGYKYVLNRILSLFLPQYTEIGTVVTRDESHKKEYTPKVDNWKICKTPMIVLTSPYSASCSEILARVLQFHKRATIVGTHVSAGEVLFSPSWDLPGGGLLKVSVRDYLDPEGLRLQGRGVTPDILLEARSFFQTRRGNDPTLDRAVSELH